MDVLIVAQITCYLMIALVGVIGNAGTIVILSFFRNVVDSEVDRTTRNLIVEACACSLISSCLAIPLRTWNIIAGGGGSSPFYHNSVGCWAYTALRVSHFLNAWLLCNMAITRTLAVFRPHKYKNLLNNSAVRWLLYVMPWILVYGTYSAASLIPLCTASVEPPGLCSVVPLADTLEAQAKYKLNGTVVLTLHTILPLALTAAMYSAIFIKLWKRHLSRRIGTGALRSSVAAAHMVAAAQPSTVLAAKQHRLQQTVTPVVSNGEMHRLRIVKVLVWTSLVMFCCLSPGPLLLGVQLVPHTRLSKTLLEVLFFSSSCVSPIVYGLTLRGMRLAWLKLICRT